ncbi:copper transport protein ctr1 [Actinomortierella ambigua]|uniref:Copper transport protein ctr1 n=1 Tax=Actinomortierella ambigua TaxID=1343610 RepID=A0A9P6Q2Y2_9FUNG|nr:copper transport protein ctr1 [Actinomortierella ambigua]
MHSLLVLGTRLGSGTFGHVHQARWGSQPCAAKTFFLDKSDFHQYTIQKEIAVLQRLRHRHIIQFYRTHEEDGHIYLLMELAEKGSLCRAIAKGELAPDDWQTKMRLASEIARGLAFIHQEKVLHRDLKSANVLLTKHMEVKLADFGLAKVRSMASAASAADQSKGGGLAGTLRWIAPELLYASTKPKYSDKSDVYALGMVMWEMAANCVRPFKDQESDALVALAVHNGDRERLPENTPALYRAWVERCWHQDPEQRPDASQVVLDHDDLMDASTVDGDISTLSLSFSLTEWLQYPGTPYPSTPAQGEIAHMRRSSLKGHDGDFDDRFPPTGNGDVDGRFPPTGNGGCDDDDDVVLLYSDSYRAKNGSAAAKRGNRDAQLFLGWIFDHGRGVDRNEKNSFWWYRQAGSQGHVVAQLRVGQMYEQGRGVDASDAMAAPWYSEAAIAGNAKAQYRLAEMHAEGRGVRQDDDEAVRWYTMAAEQGQKDAQAILEIWYSLGRGVTQSDVEAVRWLTKAAEHGHAIAQSNLGMMYRQGRGVRQNDVEAGKWFMMAGEQGNDFAQNILGWMYDEGRGVEQNDIESVKWYTRAAEQGNADAQLSLGLMYSCGRGVPRDDIEAAKWYTRAAEQGNDVIQHNLAWMYAEGRGVERTGADTPKGNNKACTCGAGLRSVSSQLSLAWMYTEGQGVEPGEIKATKAYTKAAEQGIVEIQHNLAWMYAEGRGVDQNDYEAVKWYTKAAERGYAIAQNNLGWMYEHGRGVERSDVEAVKWYGRGASQQNPYAQFNLAAMHELGLAVDQDSEEALRLYKEAAEHGDPNANLHVQWLTSRDNISGQGRTDTSAIISLYLHGAERGYAAAQHTLGRMYERGRYVERDMMEARVWYSKAAAQGHTVAAIRRTALVADARQRASARRLGV